MRFLFLIFGIIGFEVCQTFLWAQQPSETLTIGGKTILKGQDAKVVFNVARLPTHTVIDLPVYVFRSQESGPILLLTATIHGDEVNGLEIIRRMIKDQTIRPQKGTVIALPIVNVYGFLHFSRRLPDGKDLNRKFPGGRKGSLARQLAYILTNKILPHVDYGIDLHTGGARRSNHPQIRCDFDNPQALELAAAFAPPLIVHSAPLDKTFRKAAADRNKTVLVYEGGESMRLDESIIKEGINGILRTMRYLGMIDSAPFPHSSKFITKRRWIRAQEAGVFQSFVKQGEFVKKHQKLGRLSDPFGNFERLVLAFDNGYILGLNNMPVVHKGDALFHLGVGMPNHQRNP